MSMKKKTNQTALNGRLSERNSEISLEAKSKYWEWLRNLFNKFKNKMGSMCSQDTRPDSEKTESEKNGEALIKASTEALNAAEIKLRENGVDVKDLAR